MTQRQATPGSAFICMALYREKYWICKKMLDFSSNSIEIKFYFGLCLANI